jgi:antitoxin component YwqK of YwqJK toxin-antitoxin module
MNQLVNGKQEGLWERYHSNGNLYIRCNYKNDKLEGFYEEYYWNGNIAHRINFKYGKREGLYEEYYDNGNIKRQSFWKNDRYLEGIEFQNTGVLNRNK